MGLLVQAVAQSPFADSTLIIVTEDDCQNGSDHLDSHRATAYMVGPYVKQGAVVSQHYSQVNALRTIEDILGTQHINLNTAFQKPMLEAFDTKLTGHWSYTAEASTVLKSTSLTLPVKFAAGPAVKPNHDADYWAKATAQYDFTDADEVPWAEYNRVLWVGMKGNKPFPAQKGDSRPDLD